MGKEILRFDDIEIEKHKHQLYKSPNCLEDVDIENVLGSKKTFPGKNSLIIIR